MTLREKVYDSIKMDIVSGKYRPEDILNEKNLMLKYHISKAPVRDALIELCNEGVLRSIPRLGYVIVTYSTDYLDGILRFRKFLEPKYLYEYWDRIRDEDILKLESLHKKHMEKAIVKDPVSYWNTNKDFHLTLASFYHDQYFYEILKSAFQKQMLVFSQYYWNSWNRKVFNIYSHQHSEFLNYLKCREREKAVKELQKDIEYFMKG
ncbi:MAG: GntR family transcriptional regulator [Lagierella massiliensis]|nr:GntR family transcriptional regulator [Lagierella massiliensis]